ncbi:MAG: DUF5615 family PIN-like protein [Lewinellaceae bacterium]|nr:DUF5615 family PIN-like protein [Lewinellaceae bacterium]
MKVLLDENVDIRFKKEFSSSGHEVYTVRDMGWNGLKNGPLFRKMKENSFEVFVAVDKNIPYQQNDKARGKNKVFNYGAVIFVPGKARRMRIAKAT